MTLVFSTQVSHIPTIHHRTRNTHTQPSRELYPRLALGYPRAVVGAYKSSSRASA